MIKALLRVIALLAFVVAFGSQAEATTITVTSQTINNWQFTRTAGTGVIHLRLYVDKPFITSDGRPVQPGSPQGGAVYQIVPCNVSGPDASGNYTLTIPQFTLDSTVDAQDPPGMSAKYTAYFFTPQGRQLAVYAGFELFKVLPVYPTIPATWAQIRADNTANASIPTQTRSYTDQQINQLMLDAIAQSSGITSLEGQMGPTVNFVDDTNVTMVGSGNNITVTWVGQSSVARGGSGLATATANGVLYGNGTSPFGITAQGAANSILTANAGAPVFSQTPVINTSLTIGVASSQTGSLVLRNGTNANTITIAPGATSASWAWTLPTDDGAAGGLLATDGSGVSSWTMSPSVTAITTASLTVTGLTTGRVPYVGASDLISDEANFLWDASTDRLSIGTTDATNTLNLPNAGYVSGRGSVAAAQLRIAGIAGATRYTGLVSSETIDAVWLGQGGTPLAHQYTQAGATAFNPLAPDYVVRDPGGVRVLQGFASSFNDSVSANIYSFTSAVRNIGTSPTVAMFSQGIAMGPGAVAWGDNPNGYTDVDGTDTATAYGSEINFGAQGLSPNQNAFGLLIVNVTSDPSTPAGTSTSFIQLQSNAGQVDSGIVFNPGSVQPITGTLISALGITATKGIDMTLGAYSAGIDLASSTFSSGQQIRLANGGGTSSGIVGVSTSSGNVNLLRMSSGNYVELGDGDTGEGLLGLRFLSGATTAETMRMAAGTAGFPGNIGINQASTLSAQVHQTAIAKRALTANPGTPTVNVVNGSAAVVGTNTAFLTDFAPGSSFSVDFGGTRYSYTVLSVTDDVNLTLTANYGSIAGETSSAAATAYGDYQSWLAESASGDDWVSLDNQHVLTVRGNSIYGDERGMLKLVTRASPFKKLLFGVDDTGTYGYITAINSFTAYMPLILQGGAASGNTGGVVIGVPTPSIVGALLKVEAAGAKTANHVGSEFNNIATSVSTFQKISAQYLTSGSWVGPNYGLFVSATGAVDSAADDRMNISAGLYGGKVAIAPAAVQVTTPTPVSNDPTAWLDVYGYPTESITIAADTLQTTAPGTINGTGTTWNTVGAVDRIRPGDAVMFSTDTEVYEVATVVNDTQFTLTAVYNGSPASGQPGYRDDDLLRLRNAFGTERFRVESSGLTKIGGSLVQTKGADVASAASLVLGSGNVFVVTGNVTVTNIYTYSGLGADASQSGRIVTIVWGPAGGDTFDMTDGGNIKLSASITGFDSDDTLTLFFDGTNFFELARSVN